MRMRIYTYPLRLTELGESQHKWCNKSFISSSYRNDHRNMTRKIMISKCFDMKGL